MRTFEAWMDKVGDNVSKLIEKATNPSVITLLYDVDTAPYELQFDEWFREGISPKEAASLFLALNFFHSKYVLKEVK